MNHDPRKHFQNTRVHPNRDTKSHSPNSKQRILQYDTGFTEVECYISTCQEDLMETDPGGSEMLKN